jgi:HEAT repeat protein
MLWWTIQQLKSKDAGTRLSAIEKLAEEVSPKVGTALLGVLGDPEETVRKAAAKALGETRDEQFLLPLLRSLRDPDEHMREGAAAALSRLGIPDAIPDLVKLLGDVSYPARWQAARALENLNWTPPDNREAALFAVARGRIEEASMFGAEAVEPLGLVLQSGAYHQRREAVAGLSKIPDARVVRALLIAIKDSDDQVRSATVEALCRIGDPGCVDALIRSLRDAHKHVRTVAAKGLGQFGGPNVVEPLLAVMRDPHWEVREAACLSLGRLGDPRGYEPLINSLKDHDREVREAAVRGLAQLNDKRAIGPLVLVLVDAQDSVRQIAGAALGLLDVRWELSEAAQAAMPRLQEAMRHGDYWVRQAAADALARIGRLKHVEQAAPAVDASPAFSRDAAPVLAEPAHMRKQTAVEAFVAVLTDFDHELRIAAAEALGALGQVAAVTALTRSLKDGHIAVRKAAATAIETLRGKPTPETNVVLRGEDFPL